MNKYKVICFFIVLFISSPSYATGNYTVYKMSDLELSQLPPFCQVWGRRDFVATDMWVKKLHIPSIHHLCKGLKHSNKVVTYLLGPIFKLKDNIKYGIQEYTYVLDRTTDYHKPLMPFIYVQRARLYISRVDLVPDANIYEDMTLAIDDYKAAIKINPKFVRAYVDLIEVYARLKDRAGMITILKIGLENIPESKTLLKKKKKYNINFN